MRVDVMPLREGTLRDQTRQASLPLPITELETAIQRSQQYLLGEQRAEGYWVGELMVDATLVADMVAYHHWNGKVDPKWQRKAVNHLFSMQLPDGGWPSTSAAFPE
jgi:squalene cyclase